MAEIDNLARGVNVMLSLRAFKRALTAPLLFPLELLLALLMWRTWSTDTDFWALGLHQFGLPGLLVTSQFVIHRGRVLIRKLVYLGVSFATAFKNKKQRIRGQWVCFVLQATLLLPYFAAVLVWTTLFDVALLPTFGFAFFTASFLKPVRGWQTISPVQANPKDLVSDGHLFQTMQG